MAVGKTVVYALMGGLFLSFSAYAVKISPSMTVDGLQRGFEIATSIVLRHFHLAA
jgi:hypothetical protein